MRLNYIKNQNQNNKNTKLVINSIGVDVLATTDDKIYALSTIKIYRYFSFVFSVVPKKVQLLKIIFRLF